MTGMEAYTSLQIGKGDCYNPPTISCLLKLAMTYNIKRVCIYCMELAASLLAYWGL